MRTGGTITFHDAAGGIVGQVARGTFKRFSMQAADDHKRMDRYFAEHPEVETAVIDGIGVFAFRVGRSFHRDPA